MKITPQQYARVLVESVKENNISGIAKSFWYKLQKNGQYKDLPKIILALDKEYAKQSGKVLAQVYSGEALNDEQIELIEQKIAKEYSSNDSEKSDTDSSRSKTSNNIIVRNIIQKNITGIIIKIDESEIDLSLGNKINRLKNVFNSDNS